MNAAGAWQDDEDDEDEDDEDESTEFEDDDGDIADYVHEMEFDEEVLSEIRNNLMSPTDIDPILISNLEGVRIRATGFPPFANINDTGESRQSNRRLCTYLLLRFLHEQWIHRFHHRRWVCRPYIHCSFLIPTIS